MKTVVRTLAGIMAVLLSFASMNVLAQEHPDRCGTMPVLEAAFKADPALKARFEQQEVQLQQFIAARKNNPAAKEAAILTVPVVFHIVLPNPAVVTDAQVQAQVDTLNKIYSGINADTIRIPSYFKSLFGRAGIQFCLAKRTPDGKASTGINRYTTTQSSFSTNNYVKHAANGGANAWSTGAYLNIWLCQLSGGVLGYATFPNTGSGSEQGVVIDYRSLPGGSLTNYNGGKTMAHEVGHYFNLYHIWGDDGGACSGTDYVGDTPNQANNTYGSPTGIVHDACATTDPGIMYQNYMDYTDDGAMEMFTVQQVARMQSAITAYRSGLLSSGGCVPVAAKNYDAAVRLINAPATRLCTTGFVPAVTIANKGAVTLSSLAVSARVDDGAPVNINWTGSAAPLDSFTVSLPGLSTATGIHTLTVYTGPPNGVADEIPADDTLRMSLMYYEALTTPFSEGFEGEVYPPTAWDIVNEDGAISWQKASGTGSTGNNAVYIRNFDDANIGTRDYLRLPQLQLPAADSAFMTFRIAAGMIASSTPVFASDTLEVLVSTDCGASYTSLYKKSGAGLSTTQRSFTGAYTPQAGEWRKDSVNLTNYIGQGKLLIAFRNTNEQTNNIYLDDINLYGKIINPNLKRQGILVTPNPTRGLVNVDFYPTPTHLQGMAVYSSQGQLLLQIPVAAGTAANHYAFDLGRYAAGIYIVKLVFEDHVITQKILRQ